jgi:DNA-directed RNA polymerase subunit beta
MPIRLPGGRSVVRGATQILAARTNSGSNSHRISFAKITEPLELPQLLSLQTASFDWLVGNDAWTAEVERRRAQGDDVSEKSGLQEIFEEISPIEDFSETMSLSFDDPASTSRSTPWRSARRRT